jgi:uncharacterized protein
VIFIDSNIPMYLAGAPHPLKAEAQILLERVAASKERAVTDAEVLQEILHRYASLERRPSIQPALQAVLDNVDDVFSIEKRDAMRAAEILQHPSHLSARDALHIAIMERHGIQRIMSFDRDFDRWPGITRIHEI